MTGAPTLGEPHSPGDRRSDAECEGLGVSDKKTAPPGLKRRRLNVRDKLLLALLPTATVLPMLGVRGVRPTPPAVFVAGVERVSDLLGPPE